MAGTRNDGFADSCRRVECDFHGVCKVDSKGQAVCSCDLPCLQEASLRFQMASASSAVCGSDGKTHPSLCQLQRASCLDRKDVAVVHRGPCRGESILDQSRARDSTWRILQRALLQTIPAAT